MKIFFLLSFLITLFAVSCSTDRPTEHVDIPVKLKTSNKQLQSNFYSCLRLTQQLIKTQVSDKEFSEYFSLNKRATGFEYDNVVWTISDTLFELPKSYQIFYDFIYKGDTLSSFRADFDANIKAIDYRNFHLLAFRKFIDNELTITRPTATEIALKNGMKRKDLELIFYCSADKFYWECKNNCDGCLYLDIDAKTGGIIGQGKVVYQY
ncbi:MAG: hypothetical protein WBP58_14570 [Chitinophagaceae bacterium]